MTSEEPEMLHESREKSKLFREVEKYAMIKFHMNYHLLEYMDENILIVVTKKSINEFQRLNFISGM